MEEGRGREGLEGGREGRMGGRASLSIGIRKMQLYTHTQYIVNIIVPLPSPFFLGLISKPMYI